MFIVILKLNFIWLEPETRILKYRKFTRFSKYGVDIFFNRGMKPVSLTTAAITNANSVGSGAQINLYKAHMYTA